MKRERVVRMCANQLGLEVRGSNGAFKLVERYGNKRKIGTYRSVDTLQRRIVRYGKWVLREREEEF
jgi:hypothetical protein